LFKGGSLEQLDAVTDLLLHYDDYIAGQISIRKIMELPPKPISKPSPKPGPKPPPKPKTGQENR
jgi:hypothetical protein